MCQLHATIDSFNFLCRRKWKHMFRMNLGAHAALPLLALAAKSICNFTEMQMQIFLLPERRKSGTCRYGIANRLLFLSFACWWGHLSRPWSKQWWMGIYDYCLNAIISNRMKYTVYHLFDKFSLPMRSSDWLLQERTKLKVWSTQKLRE